MPSESDDGSDTVAEFERLIRESAASRPDTELVEIQELSPKSAEVLVREETSLPAGTLYRVRKEPTLDGGFDLNWDYLRDTEL